ncbi:hypothetical protein Tco_0040153 [Tanacetum coccineum]
MIAAYEANQNNRNGNGNQTRVNRGVGRVTPAARVYTYKDNSHVRTVRTDEAYGISWNKMVPKEEDKIESLMDQKIRAKAVKEDDDKRKWDDEQDGNHCQHQKKQQEVGRVYIAGTDTIAETFDEQQQQQKLQDAALVPVNEQVNISISNLRISLEKIQPDVIFKVCLEVLKQQFFYNAFIATAVVPEIYMQRSTMAETFDEEQQQQKLQDAALVPINEQMFQRSTCSSSSIPSLRNCLHKDLTHPFTPPASEKEIIRFVNQIGCVTPIKIISSLRTNDMHLPWRTFITMTNRCLTRKSSSHDRPRLLMLQLLWRMVTGINVDFAKLIWDEFKHQIETRSKGSKDPVYGMPIPDVMLNNVIKALADYLEYLAKSTGSAPAKATGRGKGLLTKDGVKFDVKKVSITKIKRSQTVTEEIGQSEEAIDDEVDSEGTYEEEVVPLVRRRFTGVSIGKESYQATEVVEEGIYHSKKLIGLVILFEATKYKMDMKKAQKASKYDFFIQQRSKGPVKEIFSDVDEVTEKADEDVEKVDTVSEKSEGAKIGDVEKDSDAQVTEEQPAGQQTRDEEHGANIELAREAQADVQISKAQLEKPEATIISSSHTLSSVEFTNQFLNEHDDVNLSEILKDQVEYEVQSMVDVPVKQANPPALRHPLVDTIVTWILETTTDLSS